MEDEIFPRCCVLIIGHSGPCQQHNITGALEPEWAKEERLKAEAEAEEDQSTLDVVVDIADFTNSVAELVVGHRRILVNGGFPEDLANVMCQAVHAKLLGLDIWDAAGIADDWPDFEPDDDE